MENVFERDVEIVERALEELLRWWSANDYGKFRWTAPGLAMAAYRHRFMRQEITFHDHQNVRQLERQSYFGGQLEAYWIGPIKQKVWQYDVVSLYPAVMRGNLYPVRLRDFDLATPLREEKPEGEIS